MEDKQIEAIINATFPGLMFFCRDLDLDEQLIVKYKPDQILTERGSTLPLMFVQFAVSGPWARFSKDWTA